MEDSRGYLPNTQSGFLTALTTFYNLNVLEEQSLDCMVSKFSLQV